MNVNKYLEFLDIFALFKINEEFMDCITYLQFALFKNFFSSFWVFCHLYVVVEMLNNCGYNFHIFNNNKNYCFFYSFPHFLITFIELYINKLRSRHEILKIFKIICLIFFHKLVIMLFNRSHYCIMCKTTYLLISHSWHSINLKAVH